MVGNPLPTSFASGVDIRRVAACLGHDDPSFTLRIYGHLLPDAEDSVRRALDAADAETSQPIVQNLEDL